jgi:hypothetical protein
MHSKSDALLRLVQGRKIYLPSHCPPRSWSRANVAEARQQRQHARMLEISQDLARREFMLRTRVG